MYINNLHYARYILLTKKKKIHIIFVCIAQSEYSKNANYNVKPNN